MARRECLHNGGVFSVVNFDNNTSMKRVSMYAEFKAYFSFETEPEMGRMQRRRRVAQPRVSSHGEILTETDKKGCAYFPLIFEAEQFH